jgi:hypothetical protein
MKKILPILIVTSLSVVVFSCRKKGELPPSAKYEAALLKDTTTIEFVDSSVFYFDTITEGDKVERDFRIKNSGNKDLLIANAFGSCGCTVPQFPKEPVKPGEVATIHVTFNSSGKHGEQSKSVTLVCNTIVRNEMLYLKGFVKDKPE